MPHAKQPSHRKRLKKAVPVLGAAAGLSLSLASGGAAGPVAHMSVPDAAAGHEIILSEEEISDISLARFMSSTKKTPQHSDPKFSLPKADAAVAVVVAAGAEAVAAVAGSEAVAAVPAAAVEDAAAVEAAADAAAFRSMGAAGAVWGVQDVP